MSSHGWWSCHKCRRFDPATDCSSHKERSEVSLQSGTRRVTHDEDEGAAASVVEGYDIQRAIAILENSFDAKSFCERY